jgi:penicillin-binding protein 1A
MKFLRFLLRLSLFGSFGALWLLSGVYLYLSPNLPNVETLRDVKLQTPMRVYTSDGLLIGQFGEQNAAPCPSMQYPNSSSKPCWLRKTTTSLATEVSM